LTTQTFLDNFMDLDGDTSTESPEALDRYAKKLEDMAESLKHTSGTLRQNLTQRDEGLRRKRAAEEGQESNAKKQRAGAMKQEPAD